MSTTYDDISVGKDYLRFWLMLNKKTKPETRGIAGE